MQKGKRSLCFFVALSICFVTQASIKVSAKAAYNEKVNLSIVFNENSIDSSTESLVVKSGGQVLSKMPEIGALEVNCNSDLIPEILKNPDVNSVSPEMKVKLKEEKTVVLDDGSKSQASNGDLYDTYQWDIKRVTNNGASFSINSGNHNVVVGIIDTGVDTQHPDLQANFLGGENFVPKDFEGDTTETGDPADIQDRNGHGTHVAGTIAGNGRIKGVAPNIGFRAYRVMGTKGETDSAEISSAIIQAVKDKVSVISMSIGGFGVKGKCYYTDPSTGEIKKREDDKADIEIYKRAIKYATQNNVVLVAAAGNEGLNCADRQAIEEYVNKEDAADNIKYDGLGYELPAGLKDIVAVSATGVDDKLASYSNYGEGFVDVTAPGGDLEKPDGSDYTDMCLSSYLGGHYAFMDGTSMATPKVSAIAALAICKYGNLGPTKIAKLIYGSCDKIDNGNSSQLYGYGLVNAYNLLTK